VTGALGGRDLFFLDSLTSPKSVAYNAAIHAGLRAARNEIFIDDATERRDDVADRIRELVKRAQQNGSAIGIGHPHPWTLEALRESRARLEASEVEIVAGDALEYLVRAGERFDVVFLDPPFRQNALPALLAKLPPRLQPGARVYLEGADALQAAAPWSALKRARAGQVSYQLLQWSAHDQSGVSGDV